MASHLIAFASQLLIAPSSFFSILWYGVSFSEAFAVLICAFFVGFTGWVRSRFGDRLGRFGDFNIILYIAETIEGFIAWEGFLVFIWNEESSVCRLFWNETNALLCVALIAVAPGVFEAVAVAVLAAFSILGPGGEVDCFTQVDPVGTRRVYAHAESIERVLATSVIACF